MDVGFTHTGLKRYVHFGHSCLNGRKLKNKLYPIWWTRIFAKVYAFGETISEPGHTFVC